MKKLFYTFVRLEMSNKGILNVQKVAGDAFPAQELWHRPEDSLFWAFEKGVCQVSSTEGSYTQSGLQSYTTKVYESENPDSFVDTMIAEKERQGFVCFGIML